MNPKFSAGTISICAAMLLLASCSKSNLKASSEATASSPATATMSAANPCSLLTRAEVESALGAGAVMTGNRNPRTGQDECRLKPGTQKGIVEIIMVVHPVQNWEALKKALMDADKGSKQISGIGDDGFVTRFLGYNVRKGDRYIQVFGDMQNDSAANDKATKYLAEKAVSRM